MNADEEGPIDNEFIWDGRKMARRRFAELDVCEGFVDEVEGADGINLSETTLSSMTMETRTRLMTGGTTLSRGHWGTLDGRCHGSGRRRNPSGVNGEGTVRMEEPGQHGEVRAELRDNTLRLYWNAESVKVAESRGHGIGASTPSRSGWTSRLRD